MEEKNKKTEKDEKLLGKDQSFLWEEDVIVYKREAKRCTKWAKQENHTEQIDEQVNGLQKVKEYIEKYQEYAGDLQILNSYKAYILKWSPGDIRINIDKVNSFLDLELEIQDKEDIREIGVTNIVDALIDEYTIERDLQGKYNQEAKEYLVEE